MKWLDKIPFIVLIIICITLGLAPFSPEPHVIEKLKMLISGGLIKPLDIFDFVLHGTPWILLGLKSIRHFGMTEKKENND